MKPYENPQAFRQALEQEAYRQYEAVTGTRLARDASGRIPSQGHNDALDAFRHAYTSGRVTQMALGMQAVARHFGDENETGPAHPNDPREHRMDLWNNEVGRRLGADTDSPDALALSIHQRLREGLLVTQLGDPRLEKLYPGDPRLLHPRNNPAGELLDAQDVERINRDVDHALDRSMPRGGSAYCPATGERGRSAALAASWATDDALTGQVRESVHRQDAARGRVPDDASERLSLQLALAAKLAQLPRVDEVAFNEASHDMPSGTRASAVYRPHGNAPPFFHASVDVVAALRTPPEETLLQLGRLSSQHGPAQAPVVAHMTAIETESRVQQLT